MDRRALAGLAPGPENRRKADSGNRRDHHRVPPASGLSERPSGRRLRSGPLRKPKEWPCEKDVEKVTIGTVHRLQGAERPIVCFSLVEGPDQAGGSFIDRDASLLNVAVSRAKRSFIVFANPGRLFRPFAEDGGQAVLPPTHQLGAHLRKRAEAKLLYPDKLVLIESAGKVAALSHLLGKSAHVVALGGAPQGLDREKGVDIAAGFVPNPTPEARARQGLEQAAAAISRVGQVVFATDDDRMGDYIAWQAKRLLAAQLGGCRTDRVLLECVTKSAVERAFTSPAKLDDRQILAEATREVVDWAVSRRLRSVVLESGREKRFGPEIAPETERLIRIGACVDANTLAGRSGPVPDPIPVGRVQGAILRLLLAHARHVLAASDLRRIRAVVKVEGETFTGIVYQPAEDRETVEAGKAAAAVAKLAGLRLRPAGAPVILREMAVPPAATTVAILASAWAKHRIEPWVAMRSLQALYDGSWSRTPDREPDPYDPIEPSSGMFAHPPITPLDRAAPPELMKGGMDRTDFSIYSLVWDRFTAMEKGECEVLDVRLDFTLEGKAGDGRAGDDRRPGIPLRVRFGGISGDGVEPAGENSAAALRKHWQAFDGVAPEFEVVSALDWDCSRRTPGCHGAQQDRQTSTYAKALERLHDKQLVQFPHGQGPCASLPPVSPPPSRSNSRPKRSRTPCSRQS